MQNNFLINLPKELLLNIFVYVPDNTFSISRVCKYFRDILDNRNPCDLYYVKNRKCSIEVLMVNDLCMMCKYFVPSFDIGTPLLIGNEFVCQVCDKYVFSHECLNFLAYYYINKLPKLCANYSAISQSIECAISQKIFACQIIYLV